MSRKIFEDLKKTANVNFTAMACLKTIRLASNVEIVRI